MSWTRRQWLACAGAASGSALMAMACGGASRRGASAPAGAGSEEVRRWLREAVDLAGERWPAVEGVAMRHEHAAASLDVVSASAGMARQSGAVLAAVDEVGRRFEVSGAQLDREGLLALARHLHELADAQRRPARAGQPGERGEARGAAAATARSSGGGGEDDRLLAFSAAELRRQAEELAARADRHGSSRIVYRGAGTDLDATTVWHVSGERELTQQLMRRRDAVAVVAATSGRPTGTEVASGRSAVRLTGSGAAGENGLGLEGPSEAELALGIERVLRLTTPAAIAGGATEVVLDPSLVGAIFEALLAAVAAPEHAGARARWAARTTATKTAAPRAGWQLLSTPSAARAYGGYVFDDTGALAAPLPLLRDGRLVAPADSAPGQRLRLGHVGDFSFAPRHLEVAAAGAPLEALIGAVRAGYALEGGGLARVDFAADRVIAHAGLARELSRGTYSGRAFAEIELSASLGDFLASISGWSAQRRALSRRELIEGWPRFWSAELPWLLGRATIRPRGAA